jgi:hypothetical protein
MKRGATPPKERRALRARVRAVGWLLGLGLLFGILGPLYAYVMLNYSGRLVLTQKISAADVARGFNFGPVYLEQGITGRYYISAVLPEVDGHYWHTTFEVLNEQLQPVFKQDELHIIGDFDLESQRRERYAKRFTLDKETGYYYFRFQAVNGVYDANQQAPPVVEFAVRQHVATGAVLWAPAVGTLVLGLFLIWLGLALAGQLSRAQARRLRYSAGAPAQAGAVARYSGRARGSERLSAD